MTIRYAIYLAPPADSPLWRFGSSVLGYDAQTGEHVAQPKLECIGPERFHELTADPRRYGFHATLKSPLRLTPGRDEEDLLAAVEDFCAVRTGFTLPRLSVEAVGANGSGDAFIALIEPEPTPELLAFEREVVVSFDTFRAPLTGEEIARRHPERLNERQREYLARYGYPGVLDEFRFHLTLTGRVPADELDGVLGELRGLCAREVGDASLRVEELAVYRQLPGERFVILTRVPLRDINGSD
jgi:hypothetical protein